MSKTRAYLFIEWLRNLRLMKKLKPLLLNLLFLIKNRIQSGIDAKHLSYIPSNYKNSNYKTTILQ